MFPTKSEHWGDSGEGNLPCSEAETLSRSWLSIKGARSSTITREKGGVRGGDGDMWEEKSRRRDDSE